MDRIIRENSEPSVRGTGFIHFVDFLIDSHTYAFKLDDSARASVYYHRNKDYIVRICDSFQTFFEYYLTDPKMLFPS